MSKTKSDLHQYLDTLRARDQRNLDNFFSRFEYIPCVRNKKVLDFGCGRGLLAHQIIRKGASEVLGLDIDEEIVDYARLNIPIDVSSSKVNFTTKPITSLKGDYFDFIFSKDALEHCSDIEFVLSEFKRVLKPGGKVILGFGPLWNSPFGDHELLYSALGFKLPWLHLFLGDEVLKNLFNNSSMEPKQRVRKEKINSIENYLNKITLTQFFSKVEKESFEFVYKSVNAHQHSALSNLGKSKLLLRLGKYWERNIYCVLEKKVETNSLKLSA